MSARTLVLEQLQSIVEAFPDIGIAPQRVVTAARNLSDLDAPAIVVKTTDYQPTPQAPLRNTTWTGTAVLISPHKDLERAEDDLERMLEELGPLLNTAALRWTNAQLTNADEQHLALDITITAIFQKE